MSARLGIVTLLVGVAAQVAGIAGPRVAYADDPIFVDWTSLLPSMSDTYNPNSANECVAGKYACVDKTIREMDRRFDPLATSCSHQAVFALSYLRTTETYRDTVNADNNFFVDTPFVNHEDAVFAKYYFQAYDNWAAGNRTAVPAAWNTAFDAAAGEQVSGSGNLFLGMNAHVNRDLPFVLAAIGIAFPDGTSRKPDHDKVNQFLNRVVDPLLTEEAARFDPAMDDAAGPLLLGYTSSFQVLAAWREMAWRNAERLVAAPDAASRASVAASIESYAATVAQSIKTAFAYTWPASSPASRDGWCAMNHG